MDRITQALLLVLIISVVECGKLKLTTKEIVRGKVLGPGYSLPVSSLEQCQALCNKRRDTCDGVVYHEPIAKCRLISKCARTSLVFNLTDYVYYSKRPQIKTDGYIHDENSDSCLRVTQEAKDYASADYDCFQEHGQLIDVDNTETNSKIAEMIKNAGSGWVWIGDVSWKDKVKPSDTKSQHIGNNLESEEPFIPDVIQWRNESLKSCWAVNEEGKWGQFSCKNENFNALCQIQSFKK